MVKYRFLIFIVCLLWSGASFAKFEFNANCIRAYENIMSLKLSTARILIEAEKRKNPTNAIPYLLDNYVNYFTLMTTESASDFERFKESKNLLLKRIERDDKSSPYYLYSLAEINLQLAISRGKAKEYFTAAIEINRAYNLFKENSKKFPDFLPNQKGLGMINAALGKLPDGLKKLFGIRGDTRSGMRMLEDLVEDLPRTQYAHFYDETVFYLSIIQTDIVIDTSNFAKIIKNTERMDKESLLRTYLRAYAALKSGNSKRTLEELSKRPTEPYYQSYPYLDYLSGMAKMQNLDPSATLSFNNYLRNYRGVNLIKDTYLRLAWLELLRANPKGYNSYAQAVRDKGYDLDWRDGHAMREVTYPAPDVSLLKARLLSDGGNYERALSQLSGKSTDDFKLLRDRIEFNYRLGRIYDLSSKDDQALRYYQQAIDLGKNEAYSFASNAALWSGMIYEKIKDRNKAKIYFNLAINMKDHDFESSIELRAKEGLKRIAN